MGLLFIGILSWAITVESDALPRDRFGSQFDNVQVEALTDLASHIRGYGEMERSYPESFDPISSWMQLKGIDDHTMHWQCVGALTMEEMSELIGVSYRDEGWVDAAVAYLAQEMKLKPGQFVYVPFAEQPKQTVEVTHLDGSTSVASTEQAIHYLNAKEGTSLYADLIEKYRRSFLLIYRDWPSAEPKLSIHRRYMYAYNFHGYRVDDFEVVQPRIQVGATPLLRITEGDGVRAALQNEGGRMTLHISAPSIQPSIRPQAESVRPSQKDLEDYPDPPLPD